MRDFLGNDTVAQILKLLGFWPPVVYAFVVFSLFWMLDRNAAPHARNAISNWFVGPKYNKEDVAAVVLYVFDRFYTIPLLGSRAFLRSALLSTVVTLLVAIQLFPMLVRVVVEVPEMRQGIFEQLITNILADYVSLFFIRRWLILGGERPILALTTAPIIGILVVVLAYLIVDVGSYSLETLTFNFSYIWDDFQNWYKFINNRRLRWALLVPALIVHLWLPLFALGVIVAQATNLTAS